MLGVGSANPAGAIASTVLVRAPVAPGGTVPLSANVAAAFAGRFTVVLIEPEPLGAAQLPPPVAVHVQVGSVSAVTWSCTLTPVASLGPPLWTVMV